ncbi:MAG: hypothetical protein ACLP5E_26715 [Streptosporangiaceae bacterium]
MLSVPRPVRALRLVAATAAQFWGLQINQETPDLDAIESLLKARYKY